MGKDPDKYLEEELGDVSIPYELTWHWQTFCELGNRRSSGQVPNPITYTEIFNYCNLYNIKLSPWEISLICSLDNIYMEHISARLSATKH